MQFAYIDESGTGQEPIAVMAGVIADSYRMRLTKSEWNSLLVDLSRIVGRNIDEIHTRDLYSGNSPWRDLNGNQRSEIIDAIFNWLRNRGHSIVYTAVNKEVFYRNLETNQRLREVGTLWSFMALHMTLMIQKRYQGAIRGRKRNIKPKGATVLIFDHEHREQQRFTELLLSPPDWTDTYYNKMPNQDKLNQIIDVPHFVDSKQVGMIQLADFICFFLRKHIELSLEMTAPEYRNEPEKLRNWTNIIFTRAIPKNNIFLTRGRCDCAELFFSNAPETIR